MPSLTTTAASMRRTQPGSGAGEVRLRHTRGAYHEERMGLHVKGEREGRQPLQVLLGGVAHPVQAPQPGVLVCTPHTRRGKEKSAFSYWAQKTGLTSAPLHRGGRAWPMMLYAPYGPLCTLVAPHAQGPKVCNSYCNERQGSTYAMCAHA